MDANKLQDLMHAVDGMGTWDLTDPRNCAIIAKLAPKLVEALKEVGSEVKCENCHGCGVITGATGGPVQTRGKCGVCKGTGSKYLFLEVL